MSTETTAQTRSPLRLAVIIGGVRHERVADAITSWLLTELAGLDGVVVDLIDLNALWTRLGPDGYEGTDGEPAALVATMSELGRWARTLRAGRIAGQASAA
ncbi:hypothetical protein [Amycolatopsis sp. lyj-112]|uniref:hypothetical protein n=1 Tax=Amycolatopsis sp. lyj-112 TaxID=2789288 RepID=UPI003979061A